jgi:hypothetical protein
MDTTTTLDATRIAAYVEFDVPVDRFIGNTDLTESFAVLVRDRVGDAGLDGEELVRRVLYLRKRGRLPRLRRSYYGRKPSDN